MARGGTHEPDGYSPYKTADGRVLKLLKSSKSKTKYFNVVETHPGKFYPKKKLDVECKGSKKMKTFGKGQETARLAAIVLAEYLDSPYALPDAPPRAAWGTQVDSVVKRKRQWDQLNTLSEELLGIPNPRLEFEQPLLEVSDEPPADAIIVTGFVP